MKVHVLKHTVCAPNDITVLPTANHSTWSIAHRVCQPFLVLLNYVHILVNIVMKHVCRLRGYL